MSFSTMNPNGQQDGGYGGGKSAGNQPMYKMAADQIQQSMGPGMAGQVGKLTTDAATGMMDKLYQGGPPKLDLSGMMPKTPEQRVAESQAGGGILRMRQPRQPFNPNPTPNPGFGGGKGMFPGLPFERQPGNNPHMVLPYEGQPGNNPHMGLPVERQY